MLVRLGLVCLIFSAKVLFADLPSPRFDRIEPLGANAGEECTLKITAKDTDGIHTLHFAHPGIQATQDPKDEKTFQVKVAPDVPAGTYDVWFEGKYGLSSARVFSVSHGLKSVAEREPNNSFEEANLVEVNQAVDGKADGNNVDYFRFTAREKQRVTIDLKAVRLDSRMDANLSLYNAGGKLLASNADYFGREPFIDFIAPADGEYVVLLHDLAYQGGEPYRLVISDLPHLENVFPRAVPINQPVTLTLIGRNLGPNSQPTSRLMHGVPLEQLTITTKFSPSEQELHGFQMVRHPSAHSSEPTAATCTLNGFHFVPNLDRPVLNAVPLMYAPNAATEEREANDTAEQAQPIALPAVVNGKLDEPQDADWFEFEVPEGGKGNYVFHVYCERIAGRADPYLLLLDDKGNVVREFDDYGHRVNAFDGHLRDPYGETGLQEKRTYRVLVKDRYDSGGLRQQYVLSIQKDPIDFHVSAIHASRRDPSSLNLWRGGAEQLDIVVHFEGSEKPHLTITAEGLPPGVHCEPMTIGSGENRGKFLLWADKDAPEFVGPIRLIATGEANGKTIRRPVTPYTRPWNNGGSRPLQALMLCLTQQAPYSLRFEPAKLQIRPGEKPEVKVIATRHLKDYDGKIAVNSLHTPGGFQLTNAVIPSGQTEATVTVELQRDLRPGVYSLTMTGDAQVPFQREEKSQPRNERVALPALPLQVEVLEKKEP